MEEFPTKLSTMLRQRARNGQLRTLAEPTGLIDFSSNDYLGLARQQGINSGQAGNGPATARKSLPGGSTGSRLVSGNHPLYAEAEARVAAYHQSPAALIYNSGYDANLGLLSAVPQRGDLVLYDDEIHASLRDGLRLSHARNYSFAHNDLDNLRERADRVVGRAPTREREVYVVTESVFSMRGDGPDIRSLLEYCNQNGFRLILDEAHAVGVLGPRGKGLAAGLEAELQPFARVVTFGKALGAHGAAVLGSSRLRTFLVNFSRSLIYTTALPPASLEHIGQAYRYLEGPEGQKALTRLGEIISVFRATVRSLGLEPRFADASGAIQCCTIGDSRRATALSDHLANAGFDVRAMRPPTVAAGSECLRFCLHSFNSPEEIREVLSTLSEGLKEGSDAK